MNTFISLAIGAGIAFPLTPYAQVNQGDVCYNWHATAQDGNGNTLTCTHTPDSGHIMYWEPQVMDR